MLEAHARHHSNHNDDEGLSKNEAKIDKVVEMFHLIALEYGLDPYNQQTFHAIINGFSRAQQWLQVIRGFVQDSLVRQNDCWDIL